MSCPDCPCPELCLGWDIFCTWAKEGDPDRLAHIRNRSRLAREPEPPPPAAALTLAKLKLVSLCPHRRISSPCGCSGATCDQNAGAFVAPADCLACIDSPRPPNGHASANPRRGPSQGERGA